MPANEFNAQLWGQFTQSIAAKLGQGSSTAAIQVLPAANPLPATGVISDLQTGLARFADIVPQWGAAFNPSGSSVVDAYQVVLSQIRETATNNANIQAQYEAAQQKLATMMGQADTFKIQQIKAWKAASAEYTAAGLTPPTFSDWFQDNGLQEYNALVAQQGQQLKAVESLLAASGIGSPLTDALATLNAALTSNAGNPNLPITINPDPGLLAAWKTRPVNPGGTTFSDTDTVYDYSKTIWKAQSGFDLFGFISVGKRDDSKTTENILSTQSKYTVDIEFAAQATLTFARNWFNDALLKNYLNGPWMPGSSFDKGTAHPYGNQSAVLPLVITSVFVVMNPKISLTLDLNSYQSVYQDVTSNLNNGVNIGPFAFGGTGNSQDAMVCQVAAFKDSRTFSIRDNSGIPQIIALVAQAMP